VKFSLSHATLLKYVSVNTKITITVSYGIHNAINTESSADVFDVGIPYTALNVLTKLPPNFIKTRNKPMIYKLREDQLRKASQRIAETSILTDIRNH
jgi:hypothetical protein